MCYYTISRICRGLLIEIRSIICVSQCYRNYKSQTFFIEVKGNEKKWPKFNCNCKLNQLYKKERNNELPIVSVSIGHYVTSMKRNSLLVFIAKNQCNL